MNKITLEELTSAIRSSFSIAEVCRKLGIAPYGGNYRTIHKMINENNLDISHFKEKKWYLDNHRYIKKPQPLGNILKTNSYYNSNKLKKRLFNENIKEKKCEICGNEIWNGSEIPLELHHINGDNTDNRIENLMILCPNCHAQTDTYRKAKSALSERKGVEHLKFRESVHGNADINPEPSISYLKYDKACAETLQGESKSNSKKEKEETYCLNCGKPTVKKRKYCSTECYHIANKGNRPDIFTLLSDFEKLKTFVQVGKKYNVSDNSVRKWCIFYGILDMIKSKSRPQQ